MDLFKIEYFNRDNPTESFPWFETLTDEETKQIRVALANRLSIGLHPDPLALFLELLKRSRPVKNVNVDAVDFHLEACIASLDIKPTSCGYVNWERFDNIDRFKFNDLSAYFEDICTGYLSDDVCVFDDTLDWVIFVMHYGGIRVVKLGGNDVSY